MFCIAHKIHQSSPSWKYRVGDIGTSEITLNLSPLHSKTEFKVEAVTSAGHLICPFVHTNSLYEQYANTTNSWQNVSLETFKTGAWGV